MVVVVVVVVMVVVVVVGVVVVSGVEGGSGGGGGMTNCDDIGCCRLVHGDAQLTPSGTISMSFRVRTYENDPCVSL